MRKKTVGSVLTVILFALALSVQATEPEVNLVPWPQSLTVMGGEMALTARSRIVYSDASLLPLAEILTEEIEAVTRLDVKVASGTPAVGDICLRLTSGSKIAGEVYKVTVAVNATVEAANYNAVAMGSVTLLQAITKDGASYRIAKMIVTDQPDAEYRGYMVDVARQYHSIETLKEIIIMCRLYKIRYLQLHLTDDQAFTFPTTAYPELAAFGSDYSMAELKDLVSFADKRGVILIPELEVPAHASCFTRAMPELFGSPTNGIINFAKPEVWEAVKTIIDEMCDVFQSTPYFHLGADEANIWGLSKGPEFSAAFKTYGVDGIEGLFNYFIAGKDKPSFDLSRPFKGQAGHDMSVVWFSFLIRPEKVADGHAYIMLNGQFEGMGIGKKWGNGFGFHGVSSVKLENDQTYFVVARYDCRSGNDVARFWINPSLDQEPDLHVANGTYTGGDIGLGHSVDFSIQGYGQGIYIYDEIRVGSTWAQVNGDLTWEQLVKTVETRQLGQLNTHGQVDDRVLARAVASLQNQCRLNAAPLVFFMGHAAAGWMKRDHPEMLEGDAILHNTATDL